MAADTKKVILFIAEGPTDEDALSPVLKKIFQNSHVRFHVVHGDLTSDFTVDNSNAVKTVNNHIKMELDRYGFKRSDIISLHCPLTEETKHLISADAIKKMKKGVVILNTSRGALIDAEALLEGIKARKVGAACLDVYEEEADIFFEDRSGHILNDELLSRLISMPNVIVTSHQAFLTEEALANIADTTVNNIKSYFERDGICDNELCYRCGNIEECRKERKQKCF